MPTRKKFTREHVQLFEKALHTLDDFLTQTAKGGAIYEANPQKVADVNRGGKHLRAALLVVQQLAEQDQRQLHGDRKKEAIHHG